MKKSIKWKLIIAFNLVVVCCILGILLFNTLFLEKLYINEKKNIIIKSYNALDGGITESYDLGYTLLDLFKKKSNGESNLARFLRELQENYNVSVVLMDDRNKTYSLYQNNNHFDRIMMNYIFKDGGYDNTREVLYQTKNYKIVISTPINYSDTKKRENDGPNEFYESKGPGENNKSSENKKYRENIEKQPGFFIRSDIRANIECFGFLSDGQTAFLLTIPISSMKEPMELFNRILIIISIFTLITGSIAIFIISNNLVKPIRELSFMAKKMSNLEFQNKYEVKTEDEIGELGNTINEMSVKLEKSIKNLKNANAELSKDLEKKEEIDKLRQDFVANVSHELKTPIALISGYAEGLESEEILNDKEQREYYASVIKDEASKMNDMVFKLLDLSAIERGMSEVDIERMDIAELVSGVVNSLEIKFKDDNIKLINKIKDEFYLWSDPYKLEQIIRNYLTNAIHYVDENKIIVIDLNKITDNIVKLSVFNTGVVLSDEDMNRVWEKFYKADKAHSREYGGTGLGLSIVKAIAEELKGKCGCERSEYETHQGMSFYFEIDIKDYEKDN